MGFRKAREGNRVDFSRDSGKFHFQNSMGNFKKVSAGDRRGQYVEGIGDLKMGFREISIEFNGGSIEILIATYKGGCKEPLYGVKWI